MALRVPGHLGWLPDTVQSPAEPRPGAPLCPGKNKAALTQLPSVGGWKTRRIQDTGLSHVGPLLSKGTDAPRGLGRSQAVGLGDRRTPGLEGVTPELVTGRVQQPAPSFPRPCRAARCFRSASLRAARGLGAAGEACDLVSCGPDCTEFVSRELQGRLGAAHQHCQV